VLVQGVWEAVVCVFPCYYRSIPGNRNWQIETADWNLDVRLDILGFRGKETLYTPRKLLRNWLAGSETVVSISRDATVPTSLFAGPVRFPVRDVCAGVEGVALRDLGDEVLV